MNEEFDMYYCVVDNRIRLLERYITENGNITFFRHWASGGKSEITSEVEYYSKDIHDIEEKFPEYFL